MYSLSRCRKVAAPQSLITGQQAYSGEPGLAAENTAFAAEMRALNADTDPLDTHGQAGDILFWHHRLGRKRA